MEIGITNQTTVSMDYEATARLGRQKGDFTAQMSAVGTQGAQGTENQQPYVLGIGFLNVNPGQSLGMTATYAKDSTPQWPIINVAITGPNGKKENFEVAIKEIDPKNATELEMFALCQYNDAIGKKEVDSSFGSWQVLKNNGRNAEYLGDFSMADSVEEFVSVKQDWNAMVSGMKENQLQAGVFKQALDSEKLLQMFQQLMDEMYERIQSGNTGAPSIQIGGASYTEDEWDKMLDNFDDIEEKIIEEMKKEHEERYAEKLEKEQGIKLTEEWEEFETEETETGE